MKKQSFGTAYLVRFVKVGDAEAVFKDGCWDVYEVIPEEVDYSWHIYIPILIFAFLNSTHSNFNNGSGLSTGLSISSNKFLLQYSGFF